MSRPIRPTLSRPAAKPPGQYSCHSAFPVSSARGCGHAQTSALDVSKYTQIIEHLVPETTLDFGHRR